MSGLAVVFHRDQRPVPRRAVQAMLDAVPYRGPDGNSIHLVGPLALGHAAFTVTPQDVAQHQPLLSPRTGCALIVDARLDNRADLLARLPDPPPPTASDAELILRAYEAWQLDAPRRLLGDFAFVLWDPRHQRLVCARDTSGQRSLFYRSDARTFAAASEIHQLFQDPSVPIAPNEDRIRDYLVPFNMWRNEPDQAATFYAGVHAVAAGHVLVVDAESQRTRRYWDLQPPPELRYRSDQEYVDHFRALLFEAVGARLRSAHALGSMLSGGLDSASVACTALELYRAGRAVDRGFASFSLVFDELECDESSLVRDVQAKYRHAAHLIPAAEVVSALSLTPSGFMRGPDKAVSELDPLYAAASHTGTRVLLSGDVADSCLFGSRLVFDSLLRQLRVRAFWRHLRTYQRLSTESLRKTAALYCLLPLLPLSLQRQVMAATVRRELARYGDRLLPTWMTQTLRVDLLNRHTRLSLAAEHDRRFASPAREHEFRLLYPPEVSRGPTGWPLEVWRPFADRRLHEFLLAVPPEQKFEPHPATDDFYAGSKLILRRAMRGILPESIRARTAKTHFASLFQSEVERHWPDYAAAFGPAGRSELAARGYVEPRLFWARLEALRGGDWGADFMYVLRSMAIETWLRSLQLARPCLVHVAAPDNVTLHRGIARAAMRYQQFSLGKEVILR